MNPFLALVLTFAIALAWLRLDRKPLEPQNHPHRHRTDLCPVLADVPGGLVCALADDAGAIPDHHPVCADQRRIKNITDQNLFS